MVRVKVVLVLLTFCLACVCKKSPQGRFVEATCIQKQLGEPILIFGSQDPNGIAWGSFNDTLEEVGFGSLQLTASDNPSLPDEFKLLCLGYLEGALTARRISQAFQNFRVGVLNDFGVTNSTEWPANLASYMLQNIKYVATMAGEKRNSDPWWNQVFYVLAQMTSVLQGYNDFRDNDAPALTELDWWIYYSGGDLDDLTIILTKNIWPPSNKADFSLLSSHWHDTHHHCTGMIRLLPDYSDFFFSQDTWSSYSTLNRIMKTYTLSPSNPTTKLNSFSVSSYPGLILSPDDFWVLDTGLLVLETTMNNFNYTLYKLCNPQQVLTFMRVQIANRLSTTGDDWTQNFIRENSGTYNNQYYVLDTKMFQPNMKPKSGFLWVVEQFPGVYHRADVTGDLLNNLFVISVNTPSSVELFNLAGYPQQIEKCGNNYWSYWNCSRMQIALRDHTNIIDLPSMQKFMRYNSWQTDPLSNGDSAEQILSRYDLRPRDCLTIGKQKVCPAAFGGLDSKITSYSDASALSFHVISSPVWETQPAWSFANSQFPDVPHLGLPDTWNFPWQYFSPSSFNQLNNNININIKKRKK